MHFCQDEVVAIAASVPFIGYFIIRVKHAWHALWHRGSPKQDGCCKDHDEH